MDTLRRPASGSRFAVHGLAAVALILGASRLSWVEHYVVLPLAQAQGTLAVALFGVPALPVVVTLACSGADTLALSLGVILAYPATLRARLAGGAGALLLVGVVNTVRIGTLGRAVASPAWFDALHLYIWPTILVLAVAAYVVAWMRVADHQATAAGQPAPPRMSRAFAATTVVFVLLFVAVTPFYRDSAAVFAIAAFIARAAGLILGSLGIAAQASDSVLWTARGGFLVTPECVSTPLIPIYLAAVVAGTRGWRRALLAVGVGPLFVALGIVRLLVVAVPGTASPTFFVHAFYQLVLAAVIVVVAALWRHPLPTALRNALAGLVVAVLFLWLIGPLYTARVVAWWPRGVPLLDDPQGAMAFLPAFQVGFFLALAVVTMAALSWASFLTGLAVLGVTQGVGLVGVSVLATSYGIAPGVSSIRAWAVAAPAVIVAAMVNRGARR